jgi:negative regulator of flagellin synthesis FlgM
MTIDIRNLQNQRQMVGQRSDAASADAAPGAAQDAPPAGDAKGSSDQVRLSPEARRLQSLQETAQTAPEVDTAKVEQVRREIAEGRYHVDPQKLASNMMALERELFG